MAAANPSKDSSQKSDTLGTVLLVMASSTVIELLMELISNYIENLLGAAAGPMGIIIAVCIVVAAMVYAGKKFLGRNGPAT